jgi:hypothetical protein
MDIDGNETLVVIQAYRLLALLGSRAERREEGEERRDKSEGRRKQGEKEERSMEKKMEKR